MTAIPGVPVTGPIVPQDSADTYHTIDLTYAKGGWRTCATTTERDAIPTERRMRGMQVYVAATDVIYRLDVGLTNADWIAFSSTVSPHTHPISDVVGLQGALDAKTGLASPTFTGTPAAPTAVAGTNTTQLATTAFVTAADTALVGGAPTNLNTLGELATAIGNDAAFATTTANALGLKAPLASPALTGTPTAPTAPNGTNTTQLATTAYVLANAVAGAGAPLASPAFTGTPTAPTAVAGTATGQLATTLFVANANAALVGTAPGSMDTLGEISTALGNDANFATTMNNALANKQPLSSILTAAAGLAGAADQMAYFTGATTMALTSITVPARSFLARNSAASQRNGIDRGLTPLTDAATIVTDCLNGNVFTVTIAGNRILGAPTNIQVGASYVWIISNDATAGRVTTLDTIFKFPAGFSWTPDTGAGKANVLSALAFSPTQLLVVPTVGFL